MTVPQFMINVFRKFHLWLLLPLLASCSVQQSLNSITSSSDFERSSNLLYDTDRGLRLDLYKPANQAKRPVVIFFYGARWSGGKKEDYQFVAGGLATVNYCTVIPNVRQYPVVRFPDFVQDGARVVKWVHDHAGEQGCDPERIFVMGHNSGAHIAAMLALNEAYLGGVGGSRKWLRGMIGLAGPYDFMDSFSDPVLRDLFAPPDRFEQSQPILFTDGLNPPLLLMHGEDDEVLPVKNTRNLARSVARASGPVETVIYPKMSHSRILESLGPLLRRQNDVLAHINEFLDKWSANNYVKSLETPDIIGTPLPP